MWLGQRNEGCVHPQGANAAPMVIPGPKRIAPPITRPRAGSPAGHQLVQLRGTEADGLSTRCRCAQGKGESEKRSGFLETTNDLVPHNGALTGNRI